MAGTKSTIQWFHLVVMSRTKFPVQWLPLVAMSRTNYTIQWLHIVVMSRTKYIRFSGSTLWPCLELNFQVSGSTL